MDMINTNLAKNIADILVNFDFSTVKKIWDCMHDKTPPSDITDIKFQANQLLWNVIEKAYEKVTDFYYIEGGFFLRAEYHNDNEEWVELIFEPCSYRK